MLPIKNCALKVAKVLMCSNDQKLFFFQQETTSKLVAVDNPLKYVAVSKVRLYLSRTFSFPGYFILLFLTGIVQILALFIAANTLYIMSSKWWG